MAKVKPRPPQLNLRWRFFALSRTFSGVVKARYNGGMAHILKQRGADGIVEVVRSAAPVARCLQLKACPDGTAAGFVSLPTPNAIYKTMFKEPHRQSPSPLEQAARRWAAAKRAARQSAKDPGNDRDIFAEIAQAEAALLAAVGE